MYKHADRGMVESNKDRYSDKQIQVDGLVFNEYYMLQKDIHIVRYKEIYLYQINR